MIPVSGRGLHQCRSRILHLSPAVGHLHIRSWNVVWMAGGLPGNGWKWKWSLGLLNLGMIGMAVALLISGYEQSQIERAIEGSSWMGYFAAQAHPWFVQGMWWREMFGLMFAAGYGLLVWDLLTIGRKETRVLIKARSIAG